MLTTGSGTGTVCFRFVYAGTPDIETYSSTASTGIDLEQIFVQQQDPYPGSDDWFNFITAFDPALYSRFAMSAYCTSHTIGPWEENLPSNVIFRAVSSADQMSAVLNVDGVPSEHGWQVIASSTGSDYYYWKVERLVLTSTRDNSSQLPVSTDANGAWWGHYTAYYGSGPVSSIWYSNQNIPKPYYNQGLFGPNIWQLPASASAMKYSVSATDVTGVRTDITASAEVSWHPLSAIVGTGATGTWSAAVSTRNDTHFANPSALPLNGGNSWPGDIYKYNQSAWSAGHLTSFGSNGYDTRSHLSGIVSFDKTVPLDAFISSATGA